MLHAGKKYRNYIKRIKRVKAEPDKAAVITKYTNVVSDAVKNEVAATNHYEQLTADEVLLEFKQRIADGNWLNTEEYVALMNAMKRKRNNSSLFNRVGDE